MDTQRIELGNTFGAGFIGAMITGVLYGLTTLQTYLYFVYYPNDGIRTRIMVATIWILDTVHFSLVCTCMYYYLVSNYANPSALTSGHWSLFLSLALNVTIAVIVQSFFTIQIFTLCSRKTRWWVTSVIFLTVIAHFCFGMETVVLFFIKKDFVSVQAPQVTFEAATPFAIFVVVSDVLITIALSVLLYESRSTVTSTNMIISTLIIYAVNRCLLTSIVAIAEVITFALAPKSLWFLAIDFTVGKLYANSLLASLNSRRSLRQASERPSFSFRQSSMVIGASSSQTGTESKSRTRGHLVNLEVTQNTSTSNDGDVELSLRHQTDSKTQS